MRGGLLKCVATGFALWKRAPLLWLVWAAGWLLHRAGDRAATLGERLMTVALTELERRSAA